MAGRSPRARPSDRADGPPDAALEVAVRVARLVGRGGRAVLVGVDGRSGSGKTSLASEVAAVLEGRSVAVALAEVEAFVPGWDGLADGVRRVAERLLAPVRDRGWAELAPWDWHAGRWSPPARIPARGCADVLLLVGCGSTSAPCAPLLDVSVWLDLDEGERRRRVTRREGDPGAWWRAWARQEGLLLAERDSARLADVRIAPTARRTASASASAADEKAPVGHPVTGAQSDRPPRLSADG